MKDASGKSAMSIDVEDWFQVENLHHVISRTSWPDREKRVEGNIDLVLQSLAENNTKATFFVLGWIAEALPRMVRHIHSEGHEIGCHGFGHDMIPTLSPGDFRNDVVRAKTALEDLLGIPILGYRAPTFSLTEWAIDILQDLGFRYDSSLFPAVVHDRYGRIKTNQAGMFEIRPGFLEMSVSCLNIFGKNIPWGGGGYFRLLPYTVFRAGVRKILNDQGLYSFYIHPWEFDPGQPRVKNLRISEKFRHYQNLRKTRHRFDRLLKDFHFCPIREILPESPPGMEREV